MTISIYLSDWVTVICGFALSLARYVLVSRTRILDGWVRNSRRQSLDCIGGKKERVRRSETSDSCERNYSNYISDSIYMSGIINSSIKLFTFGMHYLLGQHGKLFRELPDSLEAHHDERHVRHDEPVVGRRADLVHQLRQERVSA